ncbi:hypothetical protein [Bacteriovorax sp. Seq25_V]|uniref:hypothetical protein n=1 Tax=Bacteriovorax sp. Seq25_V TaxID=1201288 RepID=UPI00038A0991|nr:hypothetical protein [Bacteriovorax sp. Seq25_V]EQC47667.1 hypothetical protein M900_A0242 [Bacteriovorax sp. Seq25_V]
MNFSFKAISLAFLSATPLFAASLPTPKFDTSIYTLNVESTQVSSLKGGMRLGVYAKGEIDETSSYYGKMNIFFEEGSHSSLNNDSYSKASTFGIEEAYYQYRPIFWLRVRAGITRLDNTYSPLFIYSPSLGLQEVVKVIDFENFELQFNGNQKVISSNSTVYRTGRLTEKSANYYLSGIELNYNNKSLLFHLKYDYYVIRDLNSAIANKARYIGNTVNGNEEASKFNFKYEGHNLSAAVGFKQVFSGLTFYGQYMENSNTNDSALLAGTKLKIKEVHELKFENFDVDGDVIVSTLVSPYYGATNRQGQHYAYTKYFGADKFELNYVSAKPKKASLYQDDIYILMASFTHKF